MKNQETTWLLNEKYQGVESEAFYADCAKLAAGVPLAYLISQVPFLNCTISLDSQPLIPRPETEYWVEKATVEIKNRLNETGLPRFARKDETDGLPQTNFWSSTPKILDLCAGSGAIGVAVAKAIPEALVTFAELDPAHLPTIEKNWQSNVPVNRYIQVTQSDLFSNLPANERFDFILTNPPYIDAAANTVDEHVAKHEPHLALFGGIAGMELITRIVTEAPSFLTATGQLWIEHEPAQVTTIANLARMRHFSVITHPDQYGIPRFSVLTMAQ